MADPRLLAISDIHVGHERNNAVVDGLRPGSDGDWLIVAGDISNTVDTIESTLAMLADRFERVFWTPGNHDLWTWGGDPEDLRGEARYLDVVERCRRLGVRTPEDPFEVWTGPGGPVTVVPMFLLYDYSFGRAVAPTKDEALALARQARVLCADENLLDPDPYPSREAWCEARVAQTAERLDALDDDARTVLINHWPLRREPTQLLRHQEFAQWCGTTLTEDWHLRYRAAAVIYGHLHIPVSMVIDGVPFHEVSLGYPREWQRRRSHREPLREVLAPIEVENLGEIQRLEALAAAAVPPEESQIVGGWVARRSPGRTMRRGNSVWPREHGVYGLAEDVATCEAFYAEQDLTPRFQFSPAAQPAELVAFLLARGYRPHNLTATYTCNLGELSPLEPSADVQVELTPAPTDAWWTTWSTTSSDGGTERDAIAEMFDRITAETAFVHATRDGELAGIGMAVLDDGWFGIFNIETVPDLRRRGVGLAVVDSLMQWARAHGAGSGYVQVEAMNAPAVGLYAKAGYRSHAFDYFYLSREPSAAI